MLNPWTPTVRAASRERPFLKIINYKLNSVFVWYCPNSKARQAIFLAAVRKITATGWKRNGFFNKRIEFNEKQLFGPHEWSLKRCG